MLINQTELQMITSEILDVFDKHNLDIKEARIIIEEITSVINGKEAAERMQTAMEVSKTLVRSIMDKEDDDNEE